MNRMSKTKVVAIVNLYLVSDLVGFTIIVIHMSACPTGVPGYLFYFD